MSIRTNFILWLLAQTPVTAVVGTRVWPLKRPGGTGDTLPCIVSQKQPGSGHIDTLVGTTNCRKHHFKLSIVAETYEAADALFAILAGYPASASVGLLSGASGISMNGQTVGEATILDDYDGTDNEALFAEQQVYIITIEVGLTTTTGE